jgi:hypothetical protein
VGVVGNASSLVVCEWQGLMKPVYLKSLMPAVTPMLTFCNVLWASADAQPEARRITVQITADKIILFILVSF